MHACCTAMQIDIGDGFRVPLTCSSMLSEAPLQRQSSKTDNCLKLYHRASSLRDVVSQVLRLFPSAKGMEPTWHSIVKIGQSLYNEGPGMDPYRPDQQTPVKRMFLAGSYTKQDYIDSM